MKIEKITDEIAKTKAKISELQNRLRDLERQKTDAENNEIVTLVRGMDVAPEKLRAFLETYKQQSVDAADAPAEKEGIKSEK